MRPSPILSLIALALLELPWPPPARGAAAPLPSWRELSFEITSNKPFVPVRVNGADPAWFILDSGCSGTSIIARLHADSLHLPLTEVASARMGAGQGVIVRLARTGDVMLDLAGDTLGSPGLRVIPFEHVEAYEGRRIHGLLGQDFLKSHVVEIDYRARRIRVFEPQSFRDSGSGVSIPITFVDGLVVAEAAMTPPHGAPIPCHVVIDTGVRTTVVWYHPFVVDHGLLATQSRLVLGTIGGGMGGETKGEIGRLDSLRIGPVLLSSPTVVFSRDTTGVFAGTDADGIVGGEILRRFKVTFDEPHRRLVLEPYPEATRRFDSDMSGMFLVSPPPDFRRVIVQSVADGTPAQESGLRKDDEIVSIDGRRASELSLDAVRDLFNREGTRCRLEVKRGDRRLRLALTPRRLV